MAVKKDDYKLNPVQEALQAQRVTVAIFCAYRDQDYSKCYAELESYAERHAAMIKAIGDMAEQNPHAAFVKRHKSDEMLVHYAVKHMRPTHGEPNQLMWACAMQHFSVGNSVAHALCSRFGFNPDSRYSNRRGWHMPKPKDAPAAPKALL